MKPTGSLPDFLSQLVSVHVTQQVVTFDEQGTLQTPADTAVEMPLYEAMRQARYSLLLGELGSGKSTLAAPLVLDTLAQSQQTIALLIPAKELRLPEQLSPAAVLQAIVYFVRAYVDLTSDEAEVGELLRTEEILIVVDGLDEVAPAVAGPVLRYLAQLAGSQASLQVLASARPVELTGVSFETWKIIRTQPLTDPQRLALLKNELVASGISAADAAIQATHLLAELKALPTVNTVATTPLFLRLLFPKLLEFSKTGRQYSLTLGDHLLHDVILTRLGGWAQRDEKRASTTAFEQRFTTALHKATLLGQLARHCLPVGTLSAVETESFLLAQLADTVPVPADRVQVAREALEYASHSGLLAIGSLVEFTAQPLAEGLAAVALATEWATQQEFLPLPAIMQWRVVAFAAALARHWQLHERVRLLLRDYYRSLLLTSHSYLAAAAFIATEFQDAVSAQDVLTAYDDLPSPELVYSYHGSERTAESQTIAQLLILAGQRGVEWLYRHYLNPKISLSQMGSALVEEVVQQWVGLVLRDDSRLDVSLLIELVIPYRAYGRSQPMDLLDCLVLLFPAEFPLDEKLYLLCKHLGTETLLVAYALTALRQLAETGEREAVQAALLHRAAQHERLGLRALALWMELQDSAETELPQAIVEGAFRSISLPAEETDWGLSQAVRTRLGEQVWQQQARWSLTSNSGATAAGAAQALHQSGQKDFWLLSAALLRGLDDFYPRYKTELLLNELLEQKGEVGNRWLANSLSIPIMRVSIRRGGMEASQWRLLLPRIVGLTEGPQVLADTLTNLDVYTLPRYPEVREQLSRVLDGPRGSDFQTVLQEQLLHSEVERRWGAAAALLTYDPEQQADALLVVVQSQQGLDDTMGNWTKFCLSLNLGAGPLQHLREALPMLPRPARLFALVVLYTRHSLFEVELQQELFWAMLSQDGWSWDHQVPGPNVLADPAAITVLLTALEAEDVAVAERAGARLLAYHAASLTLTQQAACLVRSITAGNLHYSSDDLVGRLRTDVLFAEAIKLVPVRNGQMPFMQALANAIADNTQWSTVVWKFVHQSERFSSFEDEDLLTLYSIGQRYPEYRQSIGEAALTLRGERDRWRHNYQAKAMQWLTLLADEFTSSQPPAELEVALMLSMDDLPWRTYNSVAARALLARLPVIPTALFSKPITRHYARRPT